MKKFKVVVILTLIMLLTSSIPLTDTHLNKTKFKGENYSQSITSNNAEKESRLINLSFSKPTVRDDGRYVTLQLEGAESNPTNVGAPILPIAFKTLIFPFGAKINGLDVSIGDVNNMYLDKKIMPTPEPVPLNKSGLAEFTEGEIYQSNEPYPSSWVEWRTGAGIEDGKHVIFLSICVFPLRYIPAENKVEYINYINIEVKYTPPAKPLLTSDVYDLLIVAPSEFANALQPLVNHKNSYGINTILVTLDEIYNGNYFAVQGRDDAEKIKYFIKESIDNWGIDYVLIVGGYNYFPVRFCHIHTATSSGDRVDVTDLYFADIYDENLSFSSWDTNNNDIFAEYDWKGNYDILDLYPDIYLGRFAAINEDQVLTCVEKIINYETNNAYNQEWFNSIIGVGGDSFAAGDGIDEGEYDCERVFKKMGDYNQSRCYASQGTLDTVEDVSSKINEGAGFVYFSGHGGGGYRFRTHPHEKPNIWLPVDFYKNTDVYELSNGEMLPIVIHCSCSSSNFYKMSDISCWNFLSNPNGGAIATCGATGTGFASIGTWYISSYIPKISYNTFLAYKTDHVITFGQMWGNAVTRYINPRMNFADYVTIEQFEPFGDPSLRIQENNNPDKPNIPEGQIEGVPSEIYNYSSISIDSDGDDIYFLWDWGDNTQSEWLGPYKSGKEIIANHSWSSRGDYEIKVKAKDIYGSESEWSDPLPISMPKTYENPLLLLLEKLNYWFIQLFERELFPGIFNL